VKTFQIVLTVLILAIPGIYTYRIFVSDPGAARELIAEPQGELAGKVMLLELPSGRRIPVNYLREEGMVYAGADGNWWNELRGSGAPVRVLIRGENLRGHARAIEGDPDHTEEVFERLRPSSYKLIGGVLVEIRLGDAVNSAAESEQPSESPGAS
jgi:hypothetical protein